MSGSNPYNSPSDTQIGLSLPVLVSSDSTFRLNLENMPLAILSASQKLPARLAAQAWLELTQFDRRTAALELLRVMGDPEKLAAVTEAFNRRAVLKPDTRTLTTSDVTERLTDGFWGIGTKQDITDAAMVVWAKVHLRLLSPICDWAIYSDALRAPDAP